MIMTEIKSIGTTLDMDSDGFFISPCCSSNINESWQEVIDSTIAAYRYFLKEQLVSVYVRGSLVRGTAVPGVSDIDTFAVVNASRWQLDLSWIEKAQIRLAQKCSFNTSVEMQVMTLSELKDPKSLEPLGFTLKVLSSCVWGEDVSQTLPKFGLGNYLLKDLVELEESLETVLDKVMSLEDDDELVLVCQWIMKVLVRSGYCLVIPQERTFTRDLYPSYMGFKKHYPEQAERMALALQLAIKPSRDKATIIDTLTGLGQWIVTESKCSQPNLEIET